MKLEFEGKNMGKSHYVDFVAKNIGRRKTKRVVVATSGGVESMACCSLLNDEGYEVYSYFCDYGQPALEAEKYVTEKLVEKKIVRAIYSSKLDILKAMPRGALDDHTSFVPFRNIHILLNAATIAERIDADSVAIGYTSKIDEGVFFDNSFANHIFLSALFSANLGREMEIFLPVKTKTKFEMLSYLWEKKIESVSCWNAEVVNEKIVICGQCAQCLERKQAEDMML
jgi:7-cyano-7-deazaguanine synthase in queuosine biosynthesis